MDPWGLEEEEEWYSSGKDASVAASLKALPLSLKGGKCPIRGTPVNPGREWGGIIVRKKFGDKNLYSYSRPRPPLGASDAMNFYYNHPSVDTIPESAVVIAYYHTHPGGNAFFSNSDNGPSDVSFQESTYWNAPNGVASLIMTCRTKNGPQVYMLNYTLKGYTNPNNPTPIWSNGQSKPVPVKP